VAISILERWNKEERAGRCRREDTLGGSKIMDMAEQIGRSVDVGAGSGPCTDARLPSS
jgi:hypothetical protein